MKYSPQIAAQTDEGIVTRNLMVTYRNGHTALHDVNFVIPRGSVTALVGVNGAGKSTLFKAMMGFIPHTAGEISILSQPAGKALARNLVAYVPQAEDVDWDFPVLVEDVVMMGRSGHMGMLRRPRKADHDAVDEALARVGMTALRQRQIGELSGGQRKRVFLARALAQQSEVILLDEPFTGVDVQTEEQIIALMRTLAGEGRMILVSTHNLGSVPEFCDRTILIKNTVLGAGLTDDVFTRSNLEAAFGGVLRHLTLSGTTLHEDGDTREVTILTDDERPFVQYGEKTQTSQTHDKNSPEKSDPDHPDEAAS